MAKKRDKFKLSSEPEHNTGSDRYLITYADLITLLLGLFVILYAASQVDKSKFTEISEALSQVFKTDKVLQGGSGELSAGKGVLPQPEFSSQQEKSLDEVKSELDSKLSAYLESQQLSIVQNANSVTLTLPEMLLFSSGKADIYPQSYQVLDSVAAAIKNLPFEISIDGHTDNVPIRTFTYQSNWHLSVDRALVVGYYLIQKGIAEKNVVIRGFGPERPIEDNSTDYGRSKNRRVEITISQTSSEVAANTEENKSEQKEN